MNDKALLAETCVTGRCPVPQQFPADEAGASS